MDKTMLHVLSPQLQALVEASLGEALPGRSPTPQSPSLPSPLLSRHTPPCEAAAAAAAAPLPAARHHASGEQQHSQLHRDASIPSTESTAAVDDALAIRINAASLTAHAQDTTNKASAAPVKLNPSELFVLQHAESPGFVVKERFLGLADALAARDALAAFAQTTALRDAKVGHGAHLRNERAVRGDRICWLDRPRDLRDRSTGSLHPAIAHLLQRIETIVFGVKAALAPAFDIRNVTSTQLAMFVSPGDGSRFVRHADTYSSAHDDSHTTSSPSTDLVRLVTCVYYLNRDWEPAHAGQLRIYVNGPSSASAATRHWDVAPTLDTLVVFRSRDVEHEVLPTFYDRMALTVWYYGRAAAPTTTQPRTDPLALVKSLLEPARALAPTPLPSAAGAVSSTAAATLEEAGISTDTVANSNTVADSSSRDTIFVAIPSYRDPECRHTVDDLLRHAKYPSRVYIGICLQIGDDDDDPRAYFTAKYGPDQVRVTYLDYRNAAGPCVARAAAQSLWRNEAFYLQIDSHMRFRAGWDAYLVAQLRQCPSPNPILTTYPLGYTLPNCVSRDVRPTLLCATGFDDHGMLRQASKTLAVTSSKPIPSAFWAAGFAFAPSRVITDVPYDASLRFLFFGEEAAMSARLWTAGYDFYAPGETVVYHLWTRAYRRVFHELEDATTRAWRTASQRYVLQLLPASEPTTSDESDKSDKADDAFLPAAGAFALGSARSLVEYEKRIGVDFAHQHVSWAATWGHVDPMRFDLAAANASAEHAPATV